MQKSKQRISFKPQVKTEIHKSPWKSTKKAHLQIEALKLIKLIVNVSILNRKLLLKILVKISQGQGKDQLQSSYQTYWGPLLNGVFFKQQELSSIAMNTWTILWSYPSEHWESKKAFLWITFIIFGSNRFFYTQKHLSSFAFLDWIIVVIVSYSVHFIIVYLKISAGPQRVYVQKLSYILDCYYDFVIMTT